MSVNSEDRECRARGFHARRRCESVRRARTGMNRGRQAGGRIEAALAAAWIASLTLARPRQYPQAGTAPGLPSRPELATNCSGLSTFITPAAFRALSAAVIVGLALL